MGINEQGKRADDLLEGLLLSLEVSETTTVGRVGAESSAASSWATTSTSTATEAAAVTSTATSTAASATTTTTESTTSATISTAVIWARSSEVDTNATAGDVNTVTGLESSSGLLDGIEVNVSETLQVTALTVSREGDTADGAIWLESLHDELVVGLERHVTEEEGVGWCAALVTELASTGGCEAVGVVGLWWAGSAEVDVELAAIKGGTLLCGVCLGGVVSIGELDVSESLGATRFAVSDNASAAFTEFLELGLEHGLVNIP